jgi:four helix bundle protein
MSEVRYYRDLDIWQRGVNISVNVYHLTEEFPRSELYGLTSQIRRSAVSIPSNIAEGHARSTREFARFLSIARGSVSELETQLEIARRIGYLSQEAFVDLSQELRIIGKQINTLLSKIRE